MDAWKKFARDHPEALPYAACSAGTATGDFERLDEVLNAIPEIKGGREYTRSLVYKGWLIRDGIWRLLEFKTILRDVDYFLE